MSFQPFNAGMDISDHRRLCPLQGFVIEFLSVVEGSLLEVEDNRARERQRQGRFPTSCVTPEEGL